MTKDTSDIKKNETVTKKDTPDVKAENGVGAGAGSCDISSPLTVSASPHIFGSTDTRGIMLDVLLALLPPVRRASHRGMRGVLRPRRMGVPEDLPAGKHGR